MKSILPTETIIYEELVKTGKDKIGNPVFSSVKFSIDGCLVSPLTASEMVGPLSLLKRVSYNVHLPKTFSGKTPAKVYIRGGWYCLVVENGVYTDSPLPWNRSIVVEAVDNGK